MTRLLALALIALAPLLAACANTSSKPPAAGATRTLITLDRSGGFMGLSDRLVVRTDGSMTYDDKKNKTTAVARASQSDLDTLRDLLSSAQFAAAASSYSTKGGADQISYTINSNDPEKTVMTIDGAPHPKVIADLLQTLDHLRQQAADSAAPPKTP
jgi:hypothetical protein